MADDLDPRSPIDGAMAMMKMEVFGFPRLNHFNLTAQLPIMIPRDDNRLAVGRQILEKFGGFRRGSLIVDEVAEDN